MSEISGYGEEGSMTDLISRIEWNGIWSSEIIISTYLLLTQILVNCVRVSLLLIN
uniref:Uncharacterized protein n=1 Tax=Heterorhabditis bacteriophora TaxID=37862 RepID=A0A1I7W819_HETBA